MSIVRQTMRYRVTFERQADDVDDYGQPSGDWVAGDPVPCYAYTDSPGRKVNIADGVTSGLSTRLWVPMDADVVQTDRVVSVVTRRDETLYSRMTIDAVNRRVGYQEVVCRRAE